MDTDSSALVKTDLPENHKSGFVALIGQPNVGKSTLLNAWLGTKLAPVSPKPQTTRNPLLGILTRDDMQIVFVDTPGIHVPQSKLGNYMVESAKQAIPDADIVLFMVDASERPNTGDRAIVDLFKPLRDAPVVLVMNKSDLLSNEERKERRQAYSALWEFTDVVMISALTLDGCLPLLERTQDMLPLGPRFFPEDQISDQQERWIVAELIREQTMRILDKEVPYALAVVVQEFTQRPNGTTYIAANLYTERDSQKGIVIGRKGTMLKRIGQAARRDLEEFLDGRVYLELWVKVRKNWRRNEQFLKQLGYWL